MISAWIAVKQLLGIWEEVRLLDHLLELILAGLTFIFGGIYHDRLQSILNTYDRESESTKAIGPGRQNRWIAQVFHRIAPLE